VIGWPPWPKIDEKGLARYVTPDAVTLWSLGANRFDLMAGHDPYRQLAAAIYDRLKSWGISYAYEKYRPERERQEIRTPAEILRAPREGTCLDLAAVYCGLCLGSDLLPLLVVFDDHAMAAVSLGHGRREQRSQDRREQDLFDGGVLTDVDRLIELIEDEEYLAVECTGFARSTALPDSMPEGAGRADGLLPFERATAAGRAQLKQQHRKGRFRFALDVAVLHDRWHIRPAPATGDIMGYQGVVPRASYRDEIGWLLDAYTKVFVGRDGEFAALGVFSARQAPGYLLIEAPAGYGKSALLYELVRRWERGAWQENAPAPNLLYFFTRAEGRRNTAEAFLGAVNAQLLDLLGVPIGVPTGLEAQRSQLIQLWAEAVRTASPDRPLLLLVDALDEAAAGDGEVTLPDLLPAQLGPYVHVIVSSRPEPPVQERVAVEHPFRAAAVRPLPTLRQRDMQQLLFAHGVSAEPAAAMARRALTATRGEPLFARFVSEDVARDGEKILASLERDPPKAVRDYFRRQLDQLKLQAQGEIARDVLGLLLVAYGPMTPPELAGALDLDLMSVRQALEPIRRFLIGGKHLELMHQELRAAVADLFTTSERQRYQRSLLEWCAGYARKGWSSDTPDYALRCAVAHLAEAARSSSQPQRHQWTALLVRTVLSPAFQKAHKRRFHDPRALLADLERGLAASTDDNDPEAAVLQVDSWIAVLSFGLERPQVSTFELALAGDLDGAEGELAYLSVEDEWRQAVLLTCAWLGADADPAAARHLLGQVRNQLPPSGPLIQLADRVAASLEGGPFTYGALPPPPPPEVVRAIFAHLRRTSFDTDRSTLAEYDAPLGEEILAGMNALQPEFLTGPDPEALGGYMTDVPVFASEREGPLLVAFAAANPEEGDRYVREYLEIHAARPYVYYRNRSLWGLLPAMLQHPSQQWLRDALLRLAQAVLAGGAPEFDQCVPISLLALQAAGGKPEARAKVWQWTVQAHQAADRLSAVRSTGDMWSAHKRRLGALAEALCWTGLNLSGAQRLLQQALNLPYGFAGFQSLGCLTLAESLHICGQSGGFPPAQDVTLALGQARRAAHNVQDSVFCARATSRWNALADDWWPAAWDHRVELDIAAAAERLATSPSLPEFAAMHVVGERYEERAHGPGTMPLPPPVLGARTLADLAKHVYQCAPSELVRLNLDEGWSLDEQLPDAARVRVPDTEFPPLLAAWLSAAALVSPRLRTLDDRARVILRVAPAAAASPTALNTVLGRLLLVVGPALGGLTLAELERRLKAAGDPKGFVS
jgi:hypothetical protein